MCLNFLPQLQQNNEKQ
uniref:Uncharacterized protein n=1 Tax=Anguilla anguilla TaxID=7936 RepID=A0A0E9T1P9_ANGAN